MDFYAITFDELQLLNFQKSSTDYFSDSVNVDHAVTLQPNDNFENNVWMHFIFSRYIRKTDMWEFVKYQTDMLEIVDIHPINIASPDKYEQLSHDFANLIFRYDFWCMMNEIDLRHLVHHKMVLMKMLLLKRQMRGLLPHWPKEIYHNLGILFMNDCAIVIQIQWKLICYNSIISDYITKIFCICHNSTAVMSCAKFCSDRFIRILI